MEEIIKERLTKTASIGFNAMLKDAFDKEKNILSKVTVEDPATQLVFIAETGDTRYNDYSVLRSLYISDVVEAQKAAAAEE